MSLSCGCIGRGSEVLETKRQERGPAPIGEISEVPDAHETLREQVEQKTTQKVICLECHGLFPVSMGAVPPAKCHISIGKGDQALVGNGHAMCVAAEIAENIFRTAEWPFAVNDPVAAEHFTDEGVKRLRVRKMLQFAMKLDFALGERLLERFRELSSEYAPKHLLRHKEAMAGTPAHPALMIE